MNDWVDFSFDKKYIFCGDYVFKKAYSIPYSLERKENSISFFKNFEDEDCRESSKRLDNLKRARDMVAQIVYSNLTPHTKFLTLTTSETILDVPIFQRKLQTFLQSMKRYGFPLKYIYVYERQTKRGLKEGNSGSLHVHMIVFNDEKIPMDILKRSWKHGRVELKILDGLRVKNDKVSSELVRNPAAYVCKYITKESVAEWNEKCFRCSKNLKRPVEIRNEVYTYSNGAVATNFSEDIDDFFQSMFAPVYENTKVCRCQINGKTVERFLDITLSKRKDEVLND